LTPRVVVDPGVMVSALLVSTSPPAQVLDGWRERRFKMVVSDRLLDELEEVLFRPKFHQRVTTEQRTSFLALLRQRANRSLTHRRPRVSRLTPAMTTS